MLQQHTLEKLHALRLSGMVTVFEQQLAQPAFEESSFEERVALLLDQEMLYRDNRRLSRLLKAAKLRLKRLRGGYRLPPPRGIHRSFMSALASCQWFQRHQNLCVTGPTGSGKTWLACALGHQACRQGLSVRYFRLAPSVRDAAHRPRRRQLSPVDESVGQNGPDPLG